MLCSFTPGYLAHHPSRLPLYYQFELKTVVLMLKHLAATILVLLAGYLNDNLVFRCMLGLCKCCSKQCMISQYVFRKFKAQFGVSCKSSLTVLV